MAAHSRQIDRSAVAALVPVLVLVPFWLAALVLLWLPFRFVAGTPYWVFPVSWLAIGCTLFIPFVQTALLAPTLSARQPTGWEYERVAPVWNHVAATAGFSPRRYTLRVIDSDELNAFACGGHLVIVTSFAIDELRQRELAGVLAHELSHHMGFHTVALTIGHWLSVPVVALARVGFWLQNVARAASRSYGRQSPVAAVLGDALAYLLQGLSWFFLAALYASDAAANAVARQSEFEADQRAVRLGYGQELIAALRAVIRYGGGGRPIGWRARLTTGHPPARTRVARIDAMLRHPSG